MTNFIVPKFQPYILYIYQRISKVHFLLFYLLLALNSTLQSQNDSTIFKEKTDTFSTLLAEIDKNPHRSVTGLGLERHFVHLMVVPNLSSYQQIKARIENDNNYKVVLNSISKTLEEKGFIVKDFMESLKISEEKYQTRNNSIIDPFKILLENSPADIIIYVDIYLETDENAKQVGIILMAKDKYTADRYVTSPYLNSTKRYWDNFQKPALEALTLNNELDVFISQLENKLLYQINNGRKIDLEIEFENLEEISMEQIVIEKNTLFDLILDWIEEKSNFNHKVGVDPEILRMEVNIPFLDLNNQIYSPSDFGIELQNFIKETYEKHNIKNKEVQLKVVRSRVKLWLH